MWNNRFWKPLGGPIWPWCIVDSMLHRYLLEIEFARQTFVQSANAKFNQNWFLFRNLKIRTVSQFNLHRYRPIEATMQTCVNLSDMYVTIVYIINSFSSFMFLIPKHKHAETCTHKGVRLLVRIISIILFNNTILSIRKHCTKFPIS